jgi:vacuolar-type H+-ATPase subunit E/Vma4
MPFYDQVELLCQAMGAQAREEAQKMVAEAREEAARLTAEEEARHTETLERTRAEVEAQAKLEARSRLDRAELESKRELGRAKEAVLREIFDQAGARLEEFRGSPDYPHWLRRTLAAAVRRLDGRQFRVAAHPDEAKWLTPELLAEVAAAAGVGLEWAPDGDLPPGGFMVIRADGRVRLDMTFQGLLERQRDDLRAEVARRLWGS